MSDVQTDLARDVQAPAMMLAKPRVSADSFRNLAARLKARPPLVPDMQPVLVPVAPLVIAVAVPPPVVSVPEPAVVVVEPPVAPVIVAAPYSSPDFDPPIAPRRAAVQFESPEFDPIVEVEPLVEVAAVAEAAPAIVEPQAEALPELDGGFSENFTYVPQAGEEPPEAIAASDDPTTAKELADRAVELELENIWRMLLAKPTNDDRTLYLREAKLFTDEEEDLEPVAAELDLSLIEPASLVDDDLPGELSVAALTPDVLAASGGQDLAELMRSLLDIMAAGNAAGQPQERALAADTLLRLVPRLDLKPLVLLAGRLSMMEQPPHLLVARLIRDPRVEVAGPLLEDCAQLSDKDLVSVVQEGEPAKLRMVARRRRLTRAISDLLVQSGDPSVVLTLVRNMEAEISHEGFQSLLLLCESHEELLAPLATRPDFQAPAAFELFWVAPPQLRRFIISRFLTDSETLTKILKITMATKTDEEGILEPMSQHALIEGLERAARGHIEIAAEELSSLMHVSSATMTRILADVQGEAIVVMLKAAGYPRSAVTGLLAKMQDADLPLVSREREISELQGMFETLSFNKARTLLTYWDWAQSKTGPYAPVH